jgi:hypothetical protein
MSVGSVQALLDRVATRASQAQGWVGIVDRSKLAMRTDDKRDQRPWVRGRDDAGMTKWFPRTKKRPREGLRWAVASPAHALPNLDLAGYWVANLYERRPTGLVVKGVPCGRVDDAVLDSLYAKLDTLFWEEP